MSAAQRAKKRLPGEVNSSITRVRPVFSKLLRQDPSGSSWLPELLRLSSGRVAAEMAEEPGVLLPWVSEMRSYRDRVLAAKPYRIPRIELQKCFEKRVPPPTEFLRWLVKNADRRVWEEKRKGKVGAETRRQRDRLFGLCGTAEKRKAITEARAMIEQQGAVKSARKWWALEGFTEVDCCLETDRLLLFVEGKRTEKLTSSTMWYEGRHQLVRNLEAAAEWAENCGKQFGVMVIGEEVIGDPAKGEVHKSLPHLPAKCRTELMEHYLGAYTWRDVCDKTGVDYRRLPRSTAEVSVRIKFLQAPADVQNKFADLYRDLFTQLKEEWEADPRNKGKTVTYSELWEEYKRVMRDPL